MTPGLDDPSRGYLAAVVAGATTCAIQFLMTTGGLTGADASINAVLWLGLFVFLVTWLFAAVGFGIGLLLIGLPVSIGLSRMGWLSRGVAVAAGALLATLAGGFLGAMGSGLAFGLQSAAFLFVPGAIAGWTLHRVGYGRAKPL